jgi:ribosome-associated protein
LNRDGVIVITARSYRSQQRNREDALRRLVELIREATAEGAVRRATKPTLASKRRRLEEKGRRSAVKASRQAKAGPE